MLTSIKDGWFIYVNGRKQPKSYALERQIIDVAQALADARPKDKITYRHDHEVQVVSRLTRVIDDIAPSIPTGLAVAVTSLTRLDLTWNAAADVSGILNYDIERNGVLQTPAVGTSSAQTGLTGNTLYSFRIRARDTAQNVGAWSSAVAATTADLVAPSVPTGLAANGLSSSSIGLSWDASTDSGGSGIAGYRLYRNGSLTHFFQTASTSTTDTGLSASTTYSYRVAAYDNQGNESSKSAPVNANTSASTGGANTFFYDNFDSGDFSHQDGNAQWLGNTFCQVINGFSPDGNTGHCVRFDFTAPYPRGTSELRFLTGGQDQECWLRWRAFYPTGTESPFRGNRVESANMGGNKFLRMYGLPESRYPRYGASMYTSSGTNVELGPQAGVYGSGTVSNWGPSAPLINAANRGGWLDMEWYGKVATAPAGAGSGNGIQRFWINQLLVSEATDLSSFESGNIGFNGGYFNGAVDFPWAGAQTYAYIGKVGMSRVGRVIYPS